MCDTVAAVLQTHAIGPHDLRDQQACQAHALENRIVRLVGTAREQTQRVLQSADAVYGGVKMESLEKLWLGLIKHQLLSLGLKDRLSFYSKAHQGRGGKVHQQDTLRLAAISVKLRSDVLCASPPACAAH